MERTQSLIKWIQTFNVAAPKSNVAELCDGVAMAQVLAQIDPEYFNSSWLQKITDGASNWRLKGSNLRKVLKGILDYYQEVLGQQITDFQAPDVTAIAEHQDANQMGRLLQLILGCAVNCDQKQEYIQTIMGMEESVQHAVMKAIQELLPRDTPATSVPSETYLELNEQIKRLMEDLHQASENRDQTAQRCHELDQQVIALQEEKASLIAENERLTERYNKADSFDDVSTGAGRRNQQLQHTLDNTQEELFKMEASRDEYRQKTEELEKDLGELQERYEEAQRVAEEARILKDEVDVLRETSDRVAKYEAIIEMYKKKLEDMSDLKRQVKLLEDKNAAYMQEKMELEEEAKRHASLRAQLDIYKRQVQELHTKLSEETKRADRGEFDRNKLQERLGAMQREKERLQAERDQLRESCDELRLTQLQSQSSNPERMARPGQVASDPAMLEMIAPEVKEKMMRLQHENERLKEKWAEGPHIETLQTVLDDSRQRNSELESENRLANQKILELESQLEDLNASQSTLHSQHGAELRLKLNSSMTQIKELQADKAKRSAHVEELEFTISAQNERLQQLQDVLQRKDDEIHVMEERYKKHVERAKLVVKNMDPKANQMSTPEVSVLRSQLQEKEQHIANLERETEKMKALKDIEEKLMTTAFYNLTMNLQRKAVDERLTSAANMSGQSFLARQRQATSRRIGIGVPQQNSSSQPPGSNHAYIEDPRNVYL